MSDANVDQEMEAYRSMMPQLSERDRAVLEADLYLRLRPKGWRSPRGNGSAIGDWFTYHGISGAARRSAIMRLGEAGQIVWERLERGSLQLHPAARIAVLARQHEGDLAEAVRLELAAYDSGESQTERHARLAPPPAPPPTVRASQPPAADESEPDGFWDGIRAQVLAKARADFPDVPETEELVAQVVRDFQAAVKTFKAKVKAKRANRDAVITIPQLVDACLVLNQEEPQRGDDLTAWLQQASRRKKHLARAYHPDLHGGDASNQKNYQDVIDAYLICEMYVEQKKANHADRGIQRGNR